MKNRVARLVVIFTASVSTVDSKLRIGTYISTSDATNDGISSVLISRWFFLVRHFESLMMELI